jgi:hypothetical protein
VRLRSKEFVGVGDMPQAIMRVIKTENSVMELPDHKPRSDDTCMNMHACTQAIQFMFCCLLKNE